LPVPTMFLLRVALGLRALAAAAFAIGEKATYGESCPPCFGQLAVELLKREEGPRDNE
jgi:hypothetical protein